MKAAEKEMEEEGRERASGGVGDMIPGSIFSSGDAMDMFKSKYVDPMLHKTTTDNNTSIFVFTVTNGCVRIKWYD